MLSASTLIAISAQKAISFFTQIAVFSYNTGVETLLQFVFWDKFANGQNLEELSSSYSKSRRFGWQN